MCKPFGTYCLVRPTKVTQRVAQLTGVSEKTVNRIVKEKKQGQVQSPKKTATRSGVLNTINDFEFRYPCNTEDCKYTCISAEKT